MLRLLLDEHVSPAVAEGLRRQHRSILVLGIAEWAGGRFLGLADDVFLAAAADQQLTLVTYDRRTIPPLLKTWAEEGRSHGGIIFVDGKTIPSSNFGELIRALESLWSQRKEEDWTGVVAFLKRS
jgi:hypothetical protein